MTFTETLALQDVLVAGDRLAAESAHFVGLGWVRGTSGNLSKVVSRDPLRLVVTASGLDKGELCASDLAVVDGAGAPVAVEGLAPLRPSAESGLRARVAAVTGADAVVHVHFPQRGRRRAPLAEGRPAARPGDAQGDRAPGP